MTWATIRIDGIPEYRLTDADVEIAVRAAAFEGGSPAAALWTWAQRWAMFGGGSSLARIIRTHSQPVNPLWLRFGACCCGTGVCPARRGGFCEQDPCNDKRLARRVVAQRAPIEDILAGRGGANPSHAKAAIAWAKAKVSNPVPRAVDFADPAVSRGFISRNPGSFVVRKSGNWFIATPRSAGWAANHVTLELDGRVAGPKTVGTGALVAMSGAAFLGFQWWKLRRS